jgi:AcrR family transcriptional regulator
VRGSCRRLVPGEKMTYAAGKKASAARPKKRESARERVLTASYELFRRQGTSSVGIDAVVKFSGVAKTSLYRHFHSKQELIAAFLERREQLWTVDWLKSETCRRATSPADRLLAIFDVFSDWFQSEDFDGCSFINVLLEYPPGHPSRRQAGIHLSNIRTFLKTLATEAGIKNPQTFADVWHIMMKGAIVAACEGGRDAARKAKVAARLYLDSCLTARSQ